MTISYGGWDNEVIISFGSLSETIDSWSSKKMVCKVLIPSNCQNKLCLLENGEEDYLITTTVYFSLLLFIWLLTIVDDVTTCGSFF